MSKVAFRNLRTGAGVVVELILAAGEEVTHGVYQEKFGFLFDFGPCDLAESKWKSGNYGSKRRLDTASAV